MQTRAGLYHLSVGELVGTSLVHAAGSPFIVSVTAAQFNWQQTGAFGDAITLGRAGVEMTFGIQARDGYANDLSDGALYFR